jgi:hypothetical protein
VSEAISVSAVNSASALEALLTATEPAPALAMLLAMLAASSFHDAGWCISTSTAALAALVALAAMEFAMEFTATVTAGFASTAAVGPSNVGDDANAGADAALAAIAAASNRVSVAGPAACTALAAIAAASNSCRPSDDRGAFAEPLPAE